MRCNLHETANIEKKKEVLQASHASFLFRKFSMNRSSGARRGMLPIDSFTHRTTMLFPLLLLSQNTIMSIPSDAASPPLFPSNTFKDFQHPPMSVEETLDLFHQAASNADLSTYFSCFATDGYFMGTDIQERWTIPEFYSYTKPYFDQGHGWTYTPIMRNITYHPNCTSTSSIAWFDETLHNERLGTTRSSGVVVRDNHQENWKIAQYHLTIPIPNHLADAVVQMIRQVDQV
jgi:SnoaL-like domain